MNLSVTFRKMEPSDSLKEYAQEKISRVEKYLDSAVEASAVLSIEKFRHTADVTILSDGLKINGQEQTEDMYSAIDIVVDKLERQIKRHRQKIKNRKGGKRPLEVEPVPGPEDEYMIDEAEEVSRPQVLASSQVMVKSMEVEDAIGQMEQTEDNFFVFNNSATEQINILYRLENGHYGLIETSSE